MWHRTLYLTAVLLAAACAEPATAPPDADARPHTVEAAVVSNKWFARANLPGVERVDLASAAVTNSAGRSVLYTIGGQSTSGVALSLVQAFNAATNAWMNRAPLPQPRYMTNGAAVIDGKIYVSGGIGPNENFAAELFVYDPATNTWTEKQPMPTEGFRGISGVIDGKLYVLTGCDQEFCGDFVSTALYRYDPATDHWTVLARPAALHAWGYGGVIGGKLYVAGGGRAVEVYDPATNKWTSRTRLPRRRWLGASVAVGGKLYMIGGFEERPSGIVAVRTTSVYDPATDTWTTRAPYPKEFLGLPAARVFVNGKAQIHIVGGLRPGNHRGYLP